MFRKLGLEIEFSESNFIPGLPLLIKIFVFYLLYKSIIYLIKKSET